MPEKLTLDEDWLIENIRSASHRFQELHLGEEMMLSEDEVSVLLENAEAYLKHAPG